MQDSKYLRLITGLFVTILVLSNIIGGKMVMIMGVSFSAVLIVFPISYIIGDVLTEVYGYGADRRMIWTGFLCNALAVITIEIAVSLPPAPFYYGQPAYAAVLGQSPRLLVASFIAYLVGGFLNGFILAKMKIYAQGEKLWQRTIGSTLVSQAADTIIFNVVAFAGMWFAPQVFAWSQIGVIALTEWSIKCGFEILATPVTYAVVRFLKRAERLDVYDHKTDFNPLKI